MLAMQIQWKVTVTLIIMFDYGATAGNSHDSHTGWNVLNWLGKNCTASTKWQVPVGLKVQQNFWLLIQVVNNDIISDQL